MSDRIPPQWGRRRAKRKRGADLNARLRRDHHFGEQAQQQQRGAHATQLDQLQQILSPAAAPTASAALAAPTTAFDRRVRSKRSHVLDRKGATARAAAAAQPPSCDTSTMTDLPSATVLQATFRTLHSNINTLEEQVSTLV
jgi:hypothetical protein